MAAKKPEKVFRVGFVTASVFPHEVEADSGTRTIRSVSLQKRYLDGEEVKYTSSFNQSELPQALRALALAQEYVDAEEAELEIRD